MILKALAVFAVMTFVGVGLTVTTPAHKEGMVMQYAEGDTLIYPSLLDAAVITNYSERDILHAIRTGKPVDTTYFVFIK